MERFRVRVATGATLAGLMFAAASAHADRITLRGGAEIKGVIVTDTNQPAQVLVQTETAAKPLSFEKSQVLKITREASLLDDFMIQKDKVEQTAQAQYDFGIWCEESKITGPAPIFFQKAVELDPKFAPAHKKLGHIPQGDRWVTYDQQREAQGLVKYKGKWISKAEKVKLDAKSAQLAAQISWANRLKVIHRKMFEKDTATRQQAEAQFSAIRDPNAIPGLIKYFVEDGDAMRVRLGQMIGAMKGSEATEAMVALLLNEGNIEVRGSLVEETARRKDPDAVTKLVAALKAKDTEIIGHAALALASLKATASVPKLVEALIQTEQSTAIVQVAGGGGGGLSGAYGFTGNKSAAGPSPNTYGHAYGQGFSTIRSYGQIDSVAVSDNAVAFGISSSPFPGGGSSNFSNNQSSQVLAPVTLTYRNPDVLLALETLTGVDLGFDQAAWRRWVQTTFRPDTAPARRVAQP